MQCSSSLQLGIHYNIGMIREILDLFGATSDVGVKSIIRYDRIKLASELTISNHSTDEQSRLAYELRT